METMNTELAIDTKKYARLLTRTLPIPIETEAEYERLLTQAEALMEKDEDALSPEENKLLALLVTLIEHYEEQHYPITGGNPREVLRHLMEARKLTHKDVWPLFGSKGIASEVLNGKRAISKAQAKKLAEFFHVSPALFI
jgi:HTH-type transcriptional regulator / antitoxin HigA